MTQIYSPTLPQPQLLAAFAAAALVEAPANTQNWVRLAITSSRTSRDREYRIAARMELGKVVLGCSCPDWIHRRKAAGTLCKHLRAFVDVPASRDVTRTHLYPEASAYLTNGGRAFLGVLQTVNRVREER